MSIKEPVLQSAISLWIQPSGENTPWEIFDAGQVGIGDILLPGGGPRTVIYRTGLNGQAVPLTITREPPGQPTFDIEAYLSKVRDFFELARVNDDCYALQVRVADGCSDLDDPTGWSKLYQFGQVQTGDQTIGAPASREFAAATVPITTPQQPIYEVLLVKQSLSRIVNAEVSDFTGVTFISTNRGCADCPDAYNGPDQHGIITMAAEVAAPGEVLTTSNGGTTLTKTTTDPFAVDFNIGIPMMRSISQDNWRALIPRIETDGATAAEIAWVDMPKGDESNTPAWTSGVLGATVGDVITAAFWPEFGRVYAAYGAGVIAWSQTQGKSYVDLFTGSNIINDFAQDPKTGNVYAVGAGGTVLVDKGATGSFTGLTGPTADPDLDAVTIGNNGNLWVGAGTALWRSITPLPSASNHWVLANTMTNPIIKLDVKGGDRALGGDPQMLHILTSQAATLGGLALTTDGGAFPEDVPVLINAGYTDAYFSPNDPNKGFITGGLETATGVLHQISPTSGL